MSGSTSKTKQFFENLEKKIDELDNTPNDTRTFDPFGLQASINDKISRYGTAVTIGIFMGAAISAGAILGGITWYAISRNVLNDAVKDVTGYINGTLGGELETLGDLDGDNNNNNVKQKKQVSPIILASKKRNNNNNNNMIQEMEKRINELEAKVKLLEDKLVDAQSK